MLIKYLLYYQFHRDLVSLVNPCKPSPCGSYATCYVENYKAKCRCNKGYRWDGYRCVFSEYSVENSEKLKKIGLLAYNWRTFSIVWFFSESVDNKQYTNSIKYLIVITFFFHIAP